MPFLSPRYKERLLTIFDPHVNRLSGVTYATTLILNLIIKNFYEN